MAIELLDQILPHVRKAIFPRRLSLLDWRMKEGEIPGAESVRFKEKGWVDIRIPFQWGKYDKSVWFRNSLQLPDDLAGKTIGLRLSFPEALLFVNGEPIHGLDAHHSEVILATKARRNQNLLLAIEAYAGRNDRKYQFDTAELVEINPTARALYNNLKTLQELEKLLEHGLPGLADVREIIRRTLIFLKYFSPDGEEYPNAIARALGFLRSSIGTEFTDPRPGSLHLIGQSHIDVVWLWRLQETIRKCGRTFSSALRLLDEFPDLTYSQSQAGLYDLTRHHYPGVYKDMKQAIADGKWEPVGSTWIEPDCNIPSGESLTRQFLYGTQFFLGEFGRTSEVLWLPDTFGFPASLPQIMKKAGINYFFTTKLRWNDTTTFPHSSFWWEGIDGSRVLSHIPPLGLEAQLTPKDILRSGKAVSEDENPPPIMQTFGFGDGGGGPTVEDIETAGLLARMPGLVPSKLSGPTAFFKDLETHAESFPVWEQELYLEKHRGTYTTQGWVKRANREAERDLYVAEVMSVLRSNLSGAVKGPYPSADLSRTWKLLLMNQFHDIISGTSIQEAMDDARKDFEVIKQSTSGMIARAAKGLLHSGIGAKGAQTFTACNPLSFTRPSYVEVDVEGLDKGWTVRTEDGTELVSQLLTKSKNGCRLLIYIPDIPPFGLRQFVVEHAATQPTSPEGVWKFSQKNIETPRLRVRFDNRGGLSAVFDKAIRRELIQKGKRGNALQTFKDAPKEWEAWDIDSDVERNRVEILQFKGAKVVEAGPLRATLQQEFRTASGTTISQLIRMYHKTSRIDFETSVRWKERLTLLKVAFPLSVRPAQAVYEIQFGVVKRPTRSKVPGDKAKFEVPAQQWASLGDGKYGAAVVNDSKYGYDCRDNTLRLTLLRSPRFPDPVDPWHMTAAEVSDQEDHRFTYSLVPYTGDWRSANVAASARDLNVPIHVFPGVPIHSFGSFFTLSRSNIHCTAVKMAEDGASVIVRLYEAHGQATDVNMTFNRKPVGASECDLLERETKPLKVKGVRLALKFKPFEIKTLRLNFSGKRS